MAEKKPVPKKPLSLRERIAARTRRIDKASGFGPAPKPKKKVDPADGNNDTINRKSQENLK